MKPATYAELLERARANVEEVEPEALSRATAGTVTVIDVRELDEQRGGRIAGSIALPRGMLEQGIGRHVADTAAPICLVCRSGRRSLLAARSLHSMGFSRVTSLRGGIEAWRDAGLPLGDPLARPPVALPPAGERPSFDRIRADFPIVGRAMTLVDGTTRPLCYLDHAASTHPPTPILRRFGEFLAGDYANIHRGTYMLSREASRTFDACYDRCAAFIGAELERGSVTFVANTTQAIDLASHVMGDLPGDVLITQLEHHSNDLPHRRRGKVVRALADGSGALDPAEIEALLRRHRIKLVAVTGGSNVTGFLPDVHAIACLAHEYGAKILVDAAQVLAHRPLDVRPFDDPAHLDFVAAAGHKAYAPFGAAFLYGPREVMEAASPYLPGGGTASRVTHDSVSFVSVPERHQGGTPNIGGVIALAETIAYLDAIGMDRVVEHELELTRATMAGLRGLEGVRVYGPPEPERRLGVIAFNVDGVSDLQTAAVLSEERGLACRNGRFCAHPYMDRLLAEQGVVPGTDGVEPGAVRASFGLYNTLGDVERLLEAVQLVRDRKWRGRYRLSDRSVAAEAAARCNDHWMEPEVDEPGPHSQGQQS